MSPAHIRRILSKQAGVVRSVSEKEKRGSVYILIVYIRVLAGIGSLWGGDVPLCRSRYVDPTAVRIVDIDFVALAFVAFVVVTNSLCFSKCTFFNFIRTESFRLYSNL